MGAHVLENEALRVTIADDGAELISVVDKASGLERMWNADPAVWNRHAPILFPFVGKAADKNYRYEGKIYAMTTQHGFARDKEFVCVNKDAQAVTHCLKADASTKEIYPFDFELYVTHELDAKNPRVLHVRWKIVNAGEKDMYFSIGGHPGFRVPALENEKRENYWLEFPGKERVTYILLDLAQGLAIPEQKYELKLEESRVSIAPDMFDQDALVFEDSQIETVRICKPDKTPYLTMQCAGFPYLGIWSKPHAQAPFVCLEPWMGRTDNVGFAGDISERPGEQMLAANASRDMAYHVEFHA